LTTSLHIHDRSDILPIGGKNHDVGFSGAQYLSVENGGGAYVCSVRFLRDPGADLSPSLSFYVHVGGLAQNEGRLAMDPVSLRTAALTIVSEAVILWQKTSKTKGFCYFLLTVMTEFAIIQLY
jgi:hypothetical protein